MEAIHLMKRFWHCGIGLKQILRRCLHKLTALLNIIPRKCLQHFKRIALQSILFAGTTGYGYDDRGRDTLEQIYADIFHTEDAVVRIQFVNGTHAITCALFGNLRPGDVLCYVTGRAI